MDISKKVVSCELYREHTPIKSYKLSGRVVFVKRDDLFAKPPAPPLAKLRGIRVLLRNEVSLGRRTVGCYQTRVSNIGIALSAACMEFPGLRCVVVYPQSKTCPKPFAVEQARALGADVIAIRSNVLPICYSQARKIVADMDGRLLPFGMECPESINAIAAEAATVPDSLCRRGTLIVPCGSGVTLAGVLRGLHVRPKSVIGVSSGRSVMNIKKCIKRYVDAIGDLEIVAPSMPYDRFPLMDCPFPVDPYYDLKAWKFLSDNVARFGEPILFWNIGG